MKFTEYWDNNKDSYLNGVEVPAMQYLIRQVAHHSWLLASAQGRANAAKGGRLYKVIRPVFGKTVANKASKFAAKILFGH